MFSGWFKMFRAWRLMATALVSESKSESVHKASTSNNAPNLLTHILSCITERQPTYHMWASALALEPCGRLCPPKISELYPAPRLIEHCCQQKAIDKGKRLERKRRPLTPAIRFKEFIALSYPMILRPRRVTEIKRVSSSSFFWTNHCMHQEF